MSELHTRQSPPWSNGSRAPSRVPSRASSVLSTPPNPDPGAVAAPNEDWVGNAVDLGPSTQLDLISSFRPTGQVDVNGIDLEKPADRSPPPPQIPQVPPLARGLSQSHAQPEALEPQSRTQGGDRRASAPTLGPASGSSPKLHQAQGQGNTHGEHTDELQASDAHPRAHPYQLYAQNQGDETIDPTLRDQSVLHLQPAQNSLAKLARPASSQGQQAWDTLPPIQSSAGMGMGYDPTKGLPQVQTHPSGYDLPPGPEEWSLPPLQAPFTFPAIADGTGAGNDTQPSTQTNSPSSPKGHTFSSNGYPSGAGNGLWSGYDSVTDLSTYPSAPGSMGTPENGASANSSEAGYEVPPGAGSATGQEEDAEGEAEGVPPPPKKKSHARKQPEGHIKRARNAFILFRKHITDSNLIPPSVEVKHQNISVVAAKMWKEAPQEVRQKFQEQARIEKEEHQRRYPGYRYQPVFRRTDIIRRRVRKDPAEDDKVEAVAEALIKGKAGDALETEIKDQMVSRSEASESEAESTRSSRSRRRRDVGQLSKGAIRAQRAQARAKQMRQNLLGTNLLNMSLYNAATNRLASSSQQGMHAAHAHAHPGYPAHPGAAHYAQAGMGYAMEGYMPMGYDLDGRPVPVAPGYGGGEMYPPQPAGAQAHMGIPDGTGHESEMYRLPTIEGMVDVGTGYETWQAPPEGAPNGQVEYWDQSLPADMLGHPGTYDPSTHHQPGPEDYYPSAYELAGGPPPAVEGGTNGMDYRLPPLLETSREGASSVHPDTQPRTERPGDIIANQYAAGAEKGDSDGIRDWTRDAGQQTPSGHVLFNERLFDGALGTSGLQDRREGEDGLGMFDQAMEQAGEVGPW